MPLVMTESSTKVSNYSMKVRNMFCLTTFDRKRKQKIYQATKIIILVIETSIIHLHG